MDYHVEEGQEEDCEEILSLDDKEGEEEALQEDGEENKNEKNEENQNEDNPVATKAESTVKTIKQDGTKAKPRMTSTPEFSPRSLAFWTIPVFDEECAFKGGIKKQKNTPLHCEKIPFCAKDHTISTGSEALDDFLGGGFTPGIWELVGAPGLPMELILKTLILTQTHSDEGERFDHDERSYNSMSSTSLIESSPITNGSPKSGRSSRKCTPRSSPGKSSSPMIGLEARSSSPITFEGRHAYPVYSKPNNMQEQAVERIHNCKKSPRGTERVTAQDMDVPRQSLSIETEIVPRNSPRKDCCEYFPRTAENKAKSGDQSKSTNPFSRQSSRDEKELHHFFDLQKIPSKIDIDFDDPLWWSAYVEPVRNIYFIDTEGGADWVQALSLNTKKRNVGSPDENSVFLDQDSRNHKDEGRIRDPDTPPNSSSSEEDRDLHGWQNETYRLDKFSDLYYYRVYNPRQLVMVLNRIYKSEKELAKVVGNKSGGPVIIIDSVAFPIRTSHNGSHTREAWHTYDSNRSMASVAYYQNRIDFNDYSAEIIAMCRRIINHNGICLLVNHLTLAPQLIPKRNGRGEELYRIEMGCCTGYNKGGVVGITDTVGVGMITDNKTWDKETGSCEVDDDEAIRMSNLKYNTKYNPNRHAIDAFVAELENDNYGSPSSHRAGEHESQKASQKRTKTESQIDENFTCNLDQYHNQIAEDVFPDVEEDKRNRQDQNQFSAGANDEIERADSDEIERSEEEGNLSGGEDQSSIHGSINLHDSMNDSDGQDGNATSKPTKKRRISPAERLNALLPHIVEGQIPNEIPALPITSEKVESIRAVEKAINHNPLVILKPSLGYFFSHAVDNILLVQEREISLLKGLGMEV